MAINSAKWDPNSFSPELLNQVVPLLDRTHTPRGAQKLLTLDRNWDRELWIHNRKHSDSFEEIPVSKDKIRGKFLERTIRRKKRLERQKEIESKFQFNMAFGNIWLLER